MLVMMMLDRNPFHFAATCNRWSTCQGGGMGRQVWLPWPLRYSESTAPCQNLTCRVHRSREIKNMSREFKRDIPWYSDMLRPCQLSSQCKGWAENQKCFLWLPHASTGLCVSFYLGSVGNQILPSPISNWRPGSAAMNPASNPPRTRTKSPAALRQIIRAYSELIRCPICGVSHCKSL